MGGIRDVITCAEFQIEIFMGYDFTDGRIFDFCIDFSMGLTTVQRDCAACDDLSLSRMVNFVVVDHYVNDAYHVHLELLARGDLAEEARTDNGLISAGFFREGEERLRKFY